MKRVRSNDRSFILRDKKSSPGSEHLLRNPYGSVLIAVIWILGLLTVFTVAVYFQASQTLLLGRWVKERVLTRSLAKAGVERAILEIQLDEFLTFDAPSESWGRNVEAFREVSLGEGTFSVVCPINEGGDNYRFGVCDESSRININLVPERVLANLLMVVQEDIEEKRAKEIAQSIIDWRDEDDAVMEFGAEATYYRSLKNPYEPRNGPLESVEELLMIRGLGRNLFRKLQPYITVYSSGKVNFNSAPHVVLQTLGLSSELANKVIGFRRGEDGEEGTEDDEVFQIVEGITPALSAAVSFSSEEFAIIANIISGKLVSVSTNTFRIRSFGRLLRNDKIIETVVDCVVKREGTVLYWKDGAFA